MPSTVSLKEITDLGRPKLRIKMMRDVVLRVRRKPTLHFALLNLITAFIDGLASGKKGETKTAYLNYLKAHFPDLCAAVGAEVFYSKFRNGCVHEFGIKPGYAIDQNLGMRGEYVASIEVEETGQQHVVLNIDRLANDFLKHLKKLDGPLGGAS